MSVTLADASPQRAARPLIWLASFLPRLIPLAVFVLVLVAHALYVRHVAATPVDGWAAIGITEDGFLGLGPYFAAQDYLVGFSYALGTAFAAWAISQFVRQRRAATATGAIGSVSLVSLLSASGCFLIGCCGSPMLAVYLAIFGAKAFGVGRPLMAGITLLSTGGGYWYLSRRVARGACVDSCCSRQGENITASGQREATGNGAGDRCAMRHDGDGEGFPPAGDVAEQGRTLSRHPAKTP